MLRHSVRAVCLAAAASFVVLAASAAPARAQARVVVQVMDETGQSLPGTPLVLTRSTTGWKPDPKATPAKLVTDKKGKATFGFVKLGDYVLVLDEAGKSILKVSVKLRDDQKKPVRGADGEFMKDVEGGVDPNNPVVPIQIGRDVGIVEVVLTTGVPKAAAPAAQGPSGAVDIKNKDLKEKAVAAVASIQAEQFDVALTQVDGLLEKRADLAPPDLASLLYMKGFVLYRLQRETEAEPVLRESIALDPGSQPAYELLSPILVHAKNWEGAVETIRKDLELTPEPERRVPKLLNLGLALREANRNDEAIPALEEASRLAPADQAITVQLADAYTVAGRQDDADRLLGQISGPDAAVLHFNMAAALIGKKNWAGAESHFRKVIELDPSIVDARRYLGDTLLSQDKRVEAIAAFEDYLKAAPTAADAAQVKQIVDALKKEQAKRKK